MYFSKNLPIPKQEEIRTALGMEKTDDLGLYLGMPTLTSRITNQIFNHLCEKIDCRLSGWKSKYLFLAGRITLAKSTITSLATYSMQSSKIPRMICDNIGMKARGFIWGGSENKRGTHLLSWETLQKPRNQGDISIRLARQVNSSFLTKLG